MARSESTCPTWAGLCSRVLAVGLFCVASSFIGGTAMAQVAAQPAQPQVLRSTPLTLGVDQVPIPVKGSDGRLHVVYAIELANRTASNVDVDRLEVLDAASGAIVAALDKAQLDPRLVVRDRAATPGRLGASQIGLLYLHLVFDAGAAVPGVIDHRLHVHVGSVTDTFIAGRTPVAEATDLVLDAPLRGPRFIAGDACCSNTRHMQASLALNGSLYTAQRFATDWEQLDAQGRIYVGDPRDPASYIIYGNPVYAVADARVAAAVDGLPNSPPGQLPAMLPIEQVDGNHVVLDLGHGRYALYAHLQPGTVRVHAGETVRRGHLLGLVGTSGNSSEPHLHFQLMDHPSALAANGLPYRLRQFTAASRGTSTDAFDKAIIDGKPIAVEPVADPGARHSVLPLDLWIVDLQQ